MTYSINVDECRPCETKSFKINGVNACLSDFGNSKDISQEKSRQYGCLENIFVSNPNKKALCLEKYKITNEEYEKICKELETTLHVTKCEWCI